MGSTNTTANLHLSSWTETDKPQRIDFINDNNIIDSVLGNHIADTSVHISTEEKQLLKNQVTVHQYLGSGSGTQDIEFTFTPKAVICYCLNEPLCKVNSSEINIIYSGMATAKGTTGGISLSENTVTITQTDSSINLNPGECSYQLNARNKRYVLILIKTLPDSNP